MGIVSFASLIRDTQIYEQFDQFFLVHGSRHTTELNYDDDLLASIRMPADVGLRKKSFKLANIVR